jgi:hypothetical protein
MSSTAIPACARTLAPSVEHGLRQLGHLRVSGASDRLDLQKLRLQVGHAAHQAGERAGDGVQHGVADGVLEERPQGAAEQVEALGGRGGGLAENVEVLAQQPRGFAGGLRLSGLAHLLAFQFLAEGDLLVVVGLDVTLGLHRLFTRQAADPA